MVLIKYSRKNQRFLERKDRVSRVSRTGPLRAYQKSINALINNPKIIIPFLIELLIPVIMAAVFIYCFLGPEAYEFYYSSNVYITADQSLLPGILFTIVISMIFSIFIISYFDVAGIIMCNDSLRKKKVELIKAFRKAPKFYLKQTITLLSLMFIGLMLTFPLLILISIELPYYTYWAYSITSLLIYFTIILYPRIASVLTKGSGFNALIKGIKFLIDYPLYNTANIGVIIVMYCAFSWIRALSPAIHQLISALILFPWFNIFLTATFEIKHSKL